ncbi:MAG: VWA domain-containing protein [Methanophagales archaeon]|nr:VWA domain-containing protein [Methanophagales archaeon]
MKKALTIMTILIVIIPICSVSVVAQNPQSNSNREKYQLSPLEKIQVAYDAGEIGYEKALLYKVSALFDPNNLPEEYKSDVILVPIKTGTPIMEEVIFNWDNLTPETQALLEEYRVRPPNLPFSYTSPNGHFIIHYTNDTTDEDCVFEPDVDSDGDGYPDYVEEFGDIFDYVWDTEFSYGYNHPLDDPTDVYIENIGAYGITTGYDVSDHTAHAYIHVDNNYSALEGYYSSRVGCMQVTAAHEFFHCVQYTYDCFEEGWWKETTAVWMEDEIYDNVNDYLQYLPSWFANPDISLTSTAGTHEYGNCIFAKFLSEKKGTTIIKDIWEEMASTDGVTAIDNVLKNKYGTNLKTVFSDFTVTNYLNGNNNHDGNFANDQYEEGDLYDDVALTADETYSGTTINIPNTVNEWATDYIEFTSTVEDGVEVEFQGEEIFLLGSSNYVVKIVVYDLGVNASNLAKQVVGAPYLGDGKTWGGKGWNWNQTTGSWVGGKFVDSEDIKNGYFYYDDRTDSVEWGQGLDCSGLSFWAYNKAAGTAKYPPGMPSDYECPIYYVGASGQWNDGERFEQISTAIPTVSDLKMGYLLFLDTDKNDKADHVGMYVGDGEVIHSRGDKGVENKTLGDWLNISVAGTGKKYKDYFAGYGRVKTVKTQGKVIDFVENHKGKEIIPKANEYDKIVLVIACTGHPWTGDGDYSVILRKIGYLDVVLDMDRSGSMSGQKIIDAKNAEKALVNLLEPPSGWWIFATDRDKVGLVSFSSSATLDRHLTSNFNDAKNVIDGYSAGGNTNMGDALSKSINELKTNGRDNTILSIIYFTDGQTNTGLTKDEILDTLVPQAVDAGISIYTCGYGTDVDPSFLSEVASRGNGKYYFAPDKTNLTKIYIEISHVVKGWQQLASFSGTVGQGETKTAGTLKVQPGTDLFKVLLSWAGSDLDLALIDPSGNQTMPGAGVIYSGNDTLPEYYEIYDPESGDWTIQVYGKEITSPEEEYYVMVFQPGALMQVRPTKWDVNYPLNRTMTFNVSEIAGNLNLTNVTFSASDLTETVAQSTIKSLMKSQAEAEERGEAITPSLTESYAQNMNVIPANCFSFTPNNFSVPAGSSVDVQATLTLPSASIPSGTYSGNIYVNSSGGNVTISVTAIVTSVNTSTGTGTAYFATDAGSIEDLTGLNESNLPEENPNIDFPQGLFSFNITGLNPNQTVNITIAFPQDIPTTAQYWKYGPNESVNNPQPERWYQISMGSNDGDNIITIKLTDGGIGDDDGVANGIIVDQGGPGIPRPVCTAAYAVHQAGVPNPDGVLNPLRKLRDDHLKDEYVDHYYDYSPELRSVMAKEPGLAHEAARLLVKYSPAVKHKVNRIGVDERITRRDVEEIISFTDRLERSVLKNRDEIGAERSQEIIEFLDEFKEQVEACEGKTFSEALQGSIYWKGDKPTPVAARVPALTPIGIIALAGLLVVVAVSRIRRKR